MNKKKVFGFTKKFTAGILTVGMMLTGVALIPVCADAAVVEDVVIYDKKNYDINEYWDADSTKAKAPVKEGYVFGGWYYAPEENAYLTKAAIDKDSDGMIDYMGEVYAKFVPAQVLSVKAQNKAGTGNTVTDTTHARIISSLDSKNYERVGFDIWLANSVKLTKNDKTALETTRIYDGLLVGNEERHATTIFGGVSKYVSVWQLINIHATHWGKIIYVRPYWYTMDGTKVEGLAKYVHIEDQYKEYISVPVNLSSAEQIAAGTVNMMYDTALELAGTEMVSFEAGRLLPEMAFYHDTTNHIIKMVGNAATVGAYNSEESIYANIRFKKPSADTNFSMRLVQFCDWSKKEVPQEKVKVWDINYDAKETFNK